MSAFLQTFSAYSVASRPILGLGDSKTASRVAPLKGWPFINGLAVDGATTTTLLAVQIPQLPQLVTPQTVYFLDIGTNDVTAINEGTEGLATFEANAQAILTQMIAAGCIASSILVSSITPTAGNDQPQYESWFPTTLAVANFWKGLCGSFGTTYVDLLGAFTEGSYQWANISPALYITGGGHYSPAGWHLVDQTVAPLIGPPGPL